MHYPTTNAMQWLLSLWKSQYIQEETQDYYAIIMFLPGNANDISQYLKKTINRISKQLQFNLQAINYCCAQKLWMNRQPNHERGVKISFIIIW